MLQKINFLPGFNKQITATTAEGQWIGGDYVRFRYETPEKIGGWAELGESSLTGVTRAQHHFIDDAREPSTQPLALIVFSMFIQGVFSTTFILLKLPATLTNTFSTVGTNQWIGYSSG